MDRHLLRDSTIGLVEKRITHYNPNRYGDFTSPSVTAGAAGLSWGIANRIESENWWNVAGQVRPKRGMSFTGTILPS
jgi:hypothetical protein